MSENDDSTELFYNQIRLIVVIFLFHTLVFLIANRVVKNFQCTFQRDDFITERNDITIARSCLNICSFIGGLSLSAYILLPLSIFLNEILILYPDNFYVKWIDSELLKRLYISVHHGIKLSLFLIPFTFFLIQSSGTSSGSLISKSFESMSLVTIFHLLIFIISWMVLSIFRVFIDFNNFSSDHHNLACGPIQDDNGFSYLHYFDQIHTLFMKEISLIETFKFTINLLAIYIHIAYSIFSFIGLIVSLVSTPVGLISILIKILKLFQSSIPTFISKFNLNKRLEEKKIDKEYYDLVSECQKILYKDSSTTCQDYVAKIDQEIICLKRSLRHFYLNYMISWSKPIIYFSLIICILLTLGTVVAFVFMNILDIIVGIIWNIYALFGDVKPDFSTTSSQSSYFGRYFLFSDFRIGVRSSSKLGYFGALIQVILIHFLLITSVFGFFDGPIANKISIYLPIKRKTSTYQLLANISVLLLLTSALPLQAVLLGFTAINPPEDIYNPRFSPLFTSDILNDTEEDFFSWFYSLILWQQSDKDPVDFCRQSKINEQDKLESIFGTLVSYWFPSKSEKRQQEKPSEKYFSSILPFPKFRQISWNLLILLCYNIGFLATTIWIIKRKKSQDPTTEEFWRNIQNFVSPLYGARPWIRRNRRIMHRKLSQ